MVRRLKVYIHAGMHKTGTTSLQQVLLAGRDVLAARGIWYPPGGVGQSGRHLNASRGNWSPHSVDEALEQARRIGAGKVIFSHEFVSTFAAGSFEKLSAAFAGCDLTYVFAFREWSSYLPSRWAQYCRRRDSQTFGRYLEQVASGDHIDRRFDLVLDRAVSSGDCAVRAVSYPRAMARDASIVPAILRLFEFDDDLVARLRGRERLAHSSPDPQVSEIHRLLNGMIAHELGLEQDELYRSVGEGRVCRSYFDVDFSAIPEALVGAMTGLGRSSTTHHVIPGSGEAGAALERHRNLFSDLESGPVFPAMPERTVSRWSLEWPQVAGLPAMADYVAATAASIAASPMRPRSG